MRERAVARRQGRRTSATHKLNKLMASLTSGEASRMKTTPSKMESAFEPVCSARLPYNHPHARQRIFTTLVRTRDRGGSRARHAAEVHPGRDEDSGRNRSSERERESVRAVAGRDERDDRRAA